MPVNAVFQRNIEAEDAEQLEDGLEVICGRLTNPTGRNQYSNCPSKDSPEFLDLLREYHKITTSRRMVSQLLKKEHGIDVSERTITRRWKDMGLKGSRAEHDLTRETVVRLIAEQIQMDPSRRAGVNTIKKQVALRTGVHLRRDTVSEIQRVLDPAGVDARNPTSRRIQRVPLTSEGPNDVWCCDGHDKLVKYGFAIWGFRDKFSRKWLGLWVIPNNRIGIVVAYLWLKVVRQLGGIPKQSSTDCGSENTLIHGFATALREAFNADRLFQKPAHIFLRSVHHIPIERGWLDLRQGFGHNFPHLWAAGSEIYDSSNPIHRYLVMLLWPPLVQKELDKFCQLANNRRVRKQADKALPSGTTPNFAYTFPESFGGQDCLQPVNVSVIDEILNDLKPEYLEKTDWGVPGSFTTCVKEAMQILGISPEDINISNIWMMFSAIVNLITFE